MSSVVISGDTSGAITIAAPAVAGTYTQTLPMITGTLGTLNSGTAVASTSGTSIDFTSLPANIRRITISLAGVSTSGTSNPLVQIGAGSVTTSGYLGAGGGYLSGNAPGAVQNSAGFQIVYDNAAAGILHGSVVLTLVSANTWVMSSTTARSDALRVQFAAGSIALSGTLDRVRITTVNGTDTFDAGSINILYE